MSSSRGIKRKFGHPPPEASDSSSSYRAEQAQRRAKLDTPKGQECPCLHAALPQHIREIIMSSEAVPLTALLRHYHTGLLNNNITHLLILHTTSSVLLAPNISAPAEDEPAIRDLYDFHLNNPDGLLYHGPSTTPQGKGKGKDAAAAVSAGAGAGASSVSGKKAPASEGKTREETTTAGEASSAEFLGIEVQEITPMAPDWAFGRVELTPSLPPSPPTTTSSPSAQVSTTDTGEQQQQKKNGQRKVWAFLVFRKLSLGLEEEMRGWRIGRVCLLRAGEGGEPVGGGAAVEQQEGGEVGQGRGRGGGGQVRGGSGGGLVSAKRARGTGGRGV